MARNQRKYNTEYIIGPADITTTMNIYAEAAKEKKQGAIANWNGKNHVKIVSTSRQTNSEKRLTFLYISHILMAVIVLWILARPTASGRFLFVGISFFVIL